MESHTQGFEQRPTRCVGVAEVNGWRFKRYEITLDGEPLPGAVRAAINHTLAQAVAPREQEQLALGFVIAHWGSEGMWLLVEQWAGDIISHQGFRAPLDDPISFVPVPRGGPTVCVWEMEVMTHETAAWVRHILQRTSPDAGAYLADDFDNTAGVSSAELLERFDTAWSDGDVAALMELMSADPCYRASTGAGPGVDYTGRQAVAKGFAAVIAAEAATHVTPPPSGEVLVFGDRGLSFWSYAEDSETGEQTIVEGVDVWTFEQGRISKKDAYRKAFRNE